MAKHLFFDLDRTLWDFERNSETALRQLYLELGLNELHGSFELFHQTYKETNATLWKDYGAGKVSKEFLRTERFKNTFEKLDIQRFDYIEKISQGYIEISPRQTHLFPKTLETLNELKREGYQMHIITNGFKEVQFIKLEEARLRPFFDLVLCSEEVGYNKPSRFIFEHALKVTGAVATESVMIGDDYEVDIVGARNCGMHGILFDPENNKVHLEEEFRICHLRELTEKLTWILRSRL
jgi:putative hydrolase of the HAD superfamily